MKHFSSEWKEVWYVWDGVTKVKGINKLMKHSGMVINNTMHLAPLGQIAFDEYLYCAYSLGEKRRLIDCPECKDSRFKGLVDCGGYFEYRKCYECNGTGKVWEYSK